MKRIRAIYERWPDFRERLPEVWAVLRDTSVPPSSRLTRAWRIVDRHLLDRPEWLSSRTESLRDIRFRRQRAERTTTAENFHRRLHSLHTMGRSTALGASVFAVTVGLSVAVGAAFADAQVSDQVSGLAATLVTIAEVVGGAAGILFAVIVFGIQYHGEKLDKAAVLVGFLRRREGLYPIAAFTLGVVAANVIVSLICSLGLPYAAVPMAVLDVPLVLFVLWFVLWLLYRMTASVSDDFVTLLTPSLTWEYDRALDEDIHHTRQSRVFEDAVEEAGLEYQTVGGFASFDPVAPVELPLGGFGSVTDIDLTALKSLGDYLRSACPNHNPKLCVGPSDSVNNTLALVLSANRDDQGRQTSEVTAPSDEVIQQLGQMLRAVFHLSSPKKRDEVEVLSRFEEVLVSYARHDTAEQLERGLEIQESLVKRGIVRADAAPADFSIHRERLPDYLGGFQYSDLAKQAVASGDQEKVSAILDFSCRMMGLAVQREHPELYHRAGEIIVSVYCRAIEGKELADYVGGSIDNRLDTLCSQFAYARSSWRPVSSAITAQQIPVMLVDCAWRPDSSKIAAQIPVLIVELEWRLRLVRAAIEAGRTEDAMNFHDRLFRWDKHPFKGMAGPHDKQSIPSAVREASDLLGYAALVTAAWCLHLVEKNDRNADTAKALFYRCAGDFGAREHLMGVWEAVRSRLHEGRHVDDLLRVGHWTMRSSARAGVSVVMSYSCEWIERGFMALMLALPSSPVYEVPDVMRACPPFRPKSPEEVRTFAGSILGNDAVRNGLLSIADDDREETVDAVVALFAERLRSFKLDRLDLVVSTPLRDEHRSQLYSRIAKELDARHGLTETLKKLGGIQSEAHAWFSPRVVNTDWLPKESVVNPSKLTAHLVPLVARTIREREDIHAIHMAESMAHPTTTVRTLAELADAVRSAIKLLSRTTRNPILVFVPRGRRIFEALVGQQAWHLPDRCALGDHHRGEWEGCQLVQFPYSACSSVAVLDALAFYGEVEESAAARLDLKIQHPKRQKHEGWLKRARAESDPMKIPEPDAVKILVMTQLRLSVGVNHPNAALRIDLDLPRINFAMVESEGKYHRPGCDLLSAAKGEIVHTLALRLPSDDEPRTPCEHCHPDDWEEQPEYDVQNAIATE